MADEQKWAVHFMGQPDSSGRRRGQMVGGPYKSKQRARNVVDKKDNEYGSYVHQVKPYGEGANMEHHGEGKPYGGK